MIKNQYKKGDKKLLNAWALYDWANSAYPLVISSAVFPIYYGALFFDDLYIELLGFNFKNTALISFLTAFAFVILSFITPLLSGIADYMGNKKTFLKTFCYVGSLSCIGLYWFDLNNIYIGLFFYFTALISFWASLVFYNSYLPDIALKHQQDFISAKGYALGYFGSVLLLIFDLSMVLYPSYFGISGENPELIAMRYSFISVGIWWMLFSQYTFYHLPDQNQKKKIIKDVIWNGFKELIEVWNELKNIIVIKKYLIAFFVYSSALQTVLLIAAYFGEQEVNWPKDEKTIGLIVSILLIQLIAMFGAMITSKLSEKFGNIQILILLNLIWALLCIGGYFITEPIEFYIAAAFVGLIMGGIQALSRSTFSKMIPKTDNTTSYFSFFDVSQKISIVFGMTLFAFVDQITGSMRTSILVFVFIFLTGALLLKRINIKNY
ncbi:MFS transporter [Flavobacteriaceae bacterium]|mgnify:FL=1|jgi:UMF1 family MFS transporter|nr:MFS transporter [Flavobacteriaceae bacterium]MDB0069523.1 MFS transporter [Flavobacteriaceae bacterium]MDB4164059.1 MFS transporter [Flavobacteriaceae bacterium]MDB9794383.1 MFS transporter [Flavobacteriaceae bacterium]MDC1337224.1 MFS transporter [Flavobacteriaceae bacterium]|tara:strand:- start:846 stop:2153 length:1308 start_codon:yes stop_codon:yes gene_type:complete